MKVKSQAALIFLVVVILLTTPIFHMLLAKALISDTTFSSGSELFNWPAIIDCSFYIIAFTAFSLLAIRITKPSNPWLVTSLIGLTYVIYLSVFSRNYFFEGTEIIDYFWAYAPYAMPLVGAQVGYVLHAHVLAPKAST